MADIGGFDQYRKMCPEVVKREWTNNGNSNIKPRTVAGYQGIASGLGSSVSSLSRFSNFWDLVAYCLPLPPCVTSVHGSGNRHSDRGQHSPKRSVLEYFFPEPQNRIVQPVKGWLYIIAGGICFFLAVSFRVVHWDERQSYGPELALRDRSHRIRHLDDLHLHPAYHSRRLPH